MGFNTVESSNRSRQNVVDISFLEDHGIRCTSQKNVTAITDCGVAPGVSNLVIGYYNTIMQIKEV